MRSRWLHAWCLLALLPRAIHAQDRTPRLTGGAEAAGNLLYGAASQRVVTTSANARWLDRGVELRLDAATGYGDARDQSTGVRRVIVRNSRIGLTSDLHLHDRISPFGLGSLENSLQQRVGSRIIVGGGVKFTLWSPPSPIPDFSEDASLSIALLDERTSPLSVAGSDTAGRRVTRTRYSVRLRYRRQLTRHLRITHVTYYQPAVGTASRYTMDIATTLLLPVARRLDFTVTQRERIDSEARARGAPSARDGQLLFGVRTTF